MAGRQQTAALKQESSKQPNRKTQMRAEERANAPESGHGLQAREFDARHGAVGALRARHALNLVCESRKHDRVSEAQADSTDAHRRQGRECRLTTQRIQAAHTSNSAGKQGGEQQTGEQTKAKRREK